MSRRFIIVLSLLLALVGASCGDDAGTPNNDAAQTPTDADGGQAATDAANGDEPGTPGGNGTSTVTLADEVIVLDRGFGCFTEEQDAAGGGGKILLTAQLNGTNANGDEVLFDFTRFDEDSQFTGDDVTLHIGDLDTSTGGYSVGSYSARLDLNAAGEGVLRADGFDWSSSELGTAPGAFEIQC